MVLDEHTQYNISYFGMLHAAECRGKTSPKENFLIQIKKQNYECSKYVFFYEAIYIKVPRC